MKKGLLLPFMAISCGMWGQSESQLNIFAEEVLKDNEGHAYYVKFRNDRAVSSEETGSFLNSFLFPNGEQTIVAYSDERDGLGFTHIRCRVAYNNIPVAGKMVIAHTRNGKLVSVNGDLSGVSKPMNSFAISEKQALDHALAKVNASVYKWQNKSEEKHMREVMNDPNFTYYPKGNQVVVEKNGNSYLAWKFNIYAEIPLYRAELYVDATSGKILEENNLICNTDVNGSAQTKYSGTQTITCDQQGVVFRLREASRGLGIETYNMANTTTYTSTDFTNTSAAWTGTPAPPADQAARDAHWGAEKTYDYYLLQHSRNSIDNAGYKLRSYVHYSNNYNNAFWDGTRMTYGDGNANSGYNIFTALDVCGHEITHGLVANTANLNGNGSEAGALNESFADIFGTSIERFYRPSNWNWKMGSEITTNGNGFRTMQLPKTMTDPDTYLGQYWDNTGEPHNNAGPSNRWFYLMVNGGIGTNDNNNSYNVSGLGNVDAEKIAFRALTVYFVSGTTYNTARNYAIQAAKDLFGNCSNQAIQTQNAWYAVGVGAQFVPGVISPNFIAGATDFCTLPANVSFVNQTLNGFSYTWNFGDGGTSTALNPTHSYTASGSFNVKLKAIGCPNTPDSIVKSSYITILVPQLPTVNGGQGCENNFAVLSATSNAGVSWYASSTSTNVLGTGNTFQTPPLTANTTYYAATSVTSTPVYGGRLSNADGGYLTNTTQYMIFDVLQESTINSVVMYSGSMGTRTIELRNSGNTVLATATVNFPSATTVTVPLNFDVQPGTGYRLGLAAGSASDLYRSNQNSVYPYSVGGCISITGSSAGSAFYYWFYKWQVTRKPCESARLQVNATMLPAPQVGFSATNNVMCLADAEKVVSGTPFGGMYTGAGINGFIFNPMNAGTGFHQITYNYTDPNGCSGSAAITMTVDECAGVGGESQSAGIYIFPNPALDKVTVQASGKNFSYSISDASGRMIMGAALDNTSQLDISRLAKGWYMVHVKNSAGKEAHVKLVKE
jgi:bacillolysin